MVKHKRGSTLCEHCGCSNGNKANTCKGCLKPIPGRVKKWPRLALQSKDVTAMTVGLPGVPQSMWIFLYRVRREGPDFQTFATEDRGEGSCLYKDCSTAQDARQRSKSTGAFHCQHISSIREELSSDFKASKELAPVLGRASVIPELPFPPSWATSGGRVLSHWEGFKLVRCSWQECSKEQPLGLLHVRFRNSEPHPTFYCPCHTFQRFSVQLPGSGMTAKPSRRCLWEFACNSALAKEFSFFTSLRLLSWTVEKVHAWIDVVTI